MKYAGVTGLVQGLLGLMLLSNMYSPLGLIFLALMANVAYPFLLENAIEFQLWPAAVIVGTFFMFFMILAIGEIAANISSTLRKSSTMTPER